MQTGMANFKLYKTVKLVLLVVASCLIAFLAEWDAATDIRLVMHPRFTLALDLFAEARGTDYLRSLAGIVT